MFDVVLVQLGRTMVAAADDVMSHVLRERRDVEKKDRNQFNAGSTKKKLAGSLKYTLKGKEQEKFDHMIALCSQINHFDAISMLPNLHRHPLSSFHFTSDF